jgi:hypothetical protein
VPGRRSLPYFGRSRASKTRNVNGAQPGRGGAATGSPELRGSPESVSNSVNRVGNSRSQTEHFDVRAIDNWLGNAVRPAFSAHPYGLSQINQPHYRLSDFSARWKTAAGLLFGSGGGFENLSVAAFMLTPMAAATSGWCR